MAFDPVTYCWLMRISLELFAKGGEDGPEHNRAHRLVNAWEFAKLAKQAAQMGRYVIAVSTASRIRASASSQSRSWETSTASRPRCR